MTAAPNADKNAWLQPGAFKVAPGIVRIPLELPMDGLRAVNVYAVRGGERTVLIDAGWALERSERQLEQGLGAIDVDLGQVTDFVVTHAHEDHYTLASVVKRRFGTKILIGEAERPQIETLNSVGVAGDPFVTMMYECGAPKLAGRLQRQPITANPQNWPLPDGYLADGSVLDLGDRRVRCIHTPGHTVGHMVFHDETAGVMFTGDHVLPHITPSLAFEQKPSASPLADYLRSLHLMLTLPDAMMLPGHGPAGGRVHKRVSELIDHHEERLARTLEAIVGGARTVFEAAGELPWTSRNRRLAEMDDMNAMLAVLETRWHLEVLVERAQVSRSTDAAGVLRYAPRRPTGEKPGESEDNS